MAKRVKTSFLSSGFNPHSGHVVASLDETLYDDYLCFAASNKQQIYMGRSQTSTGKLQNTVNPLVGEDNLSKIKAPLSLPRQWRRKGRLSKSQEFWCTSRFSNVKKNPTLDLWSPSLYRYTIHERTKSKLPHFLAESDRFSHLVVECLESFCLFEVIQRDFYNRISWAPFHQQVKISWHGFDHHRRRWKLFSKNKKHLIVRH